MAGNHEDRDFMILDIRMATISTQNPVNKHYKTREITMMKPNWL